MKTHSTATAENIAQVALVGSPNCGKTTLFNRLTGLQQVTGNWPGVTVEKKTGVMEIANRHYHFTDLPGTYSLEKHQQTGLDEQVTLSFLENEDVDLIINVVDATSLERQLFLTAQLLHMGLPVVVALNRMDLLKEHNLEIDIEQLAASLGCPVIPVSAYFNQGVDDLKEQLSNLLNRPAQLTFELPKTLEDSIQGVKELYSESEAESSSCWLPLQRLIHPEINQTQAQSYCQHEKEKLEHDFGEDLALIAADLYFQFAHDVTQACLTRTDRFSRNLTDTLDKWALHPVLGLPIFLVVMYLVFAFSITIGNTFIDFFDLGAQALFVDGPTALLESVNAPSWLIAFLAQGIGGGMQVVATFIPVIGALFLLLTILEETGYMQRAALIMDQMMRRLGLSGQSFIPLVVGFGCNIPAVLATRTLPDHRNRIITALMAPFMSCSARLTVYVMFATAFFVDYAALFVFSLYVIGILAAILTAFILKHTLLPGEAPSMLMELPIYNRPSTFNVLLNTHNKLKSFVFNAGKIIVIVVMALNFFNSLGTDGTFGHENQPTSVLGSVAKAATPVVEPLGITEENWPATVGLFTGILAKEVVVGSLDALYQNMGGAQPSQTEDEYQFWPALTEAFMTIPANLPGLITDVDDPLGLQSLQHVTDQSAVAEEQEFELSTLDKMVNYFDGTAGAYAYMLLILLYFPCVATFGALKQELGWRWTLFSSAWSIALGYGVAVAFYQVATFDQHPETSTWWLTVISATFMATIAILYWIGRPHRLAAKQINQHDTA